MSEAISSAPVSNSQSPAEGNPIEGQSNVPKKTETPEQKEKRLLKAKVNGREVDVDEDTLIKTYQKRESAEEKLREVAKMKKEVDDFYKALEEDPESILNDPRLPLKKRDLALKWLQEQLSEELSEPEDPREIKLREKEKELEKYKRMEQEQKEAQEREEREKFTAQRREAIASTLTKALEMSPLSQDPEVQAETLREMAMYLRLCKQAGYDVSPEEIAEHVEKKHNSAVQKLVGRLKGEKLIKYLGDSIINEVRRYDLAQLNQSRSAPPPEVAQEWQPSEKPNKREFVDPQELRRRSKGLITSNS